jgi:D-lactate dehydrogenase (cytochrome)
VRPWTTDVAVPLSRLAQCIEETQHDIRQSFLVAPIVGHVGDGNFHVLIMVDSTSPTELAEAKRLNARMVHSSYYFEHIQNTEFACLMQIERALAMGGTCTGEHGVGTGKKPFLEQEVGEEAIQLMRDLKLAMDPHWIMNPGKVFDQRPGHSQRGASSDAASSVCGCL